MQSIITSATEEATTGYKPIVNNFGQPIEDQINQRLSNNPEKNQKPKSNEPSQKAKNRYSNAVNDAQRKLNLDEEQAKGFVNNIVGNEGYMNKQHIKEVDDNIQEALQKRKERIVPEEKPAPSLDERLKKFKESNREERLEKFKKNFNTQNDQVELFYNGDAKYDPNNIQNVSAISQTEIDSTINDYERKKGNVSEPKYKDVDQLSLDGMLPSDKPITPEPVMDNQIKMDIDDTGRLRHYGDISKEKYYKTYEEKENIIKKLVESDEALMFDGGLSKEQAFARNVNQGKLGHKLDTELKKTIPKESPIRAKANANKVAQEAVEETAAAATKGALEEGVEKVVKNNADDVAKKFSKARIGRIGAAVGVGALIISNMNKNKGQQPNSQLYGQQTPYGY